MTALPPKMSATARGRDLRRGHLLARGAEVEADRRAGDRGQPYSAQCSPAA